MNRKLARSPKHHSPVLSDEEMRCLRRSAWLRQGVIVIRPEDIKDDWTRRAVVNEAERLFGARREVQ